MEQALKAVTDRYEELKALVGNKKIPTRGSEWARMSKWQCFMLGLELAIETIEDEIKKDDKGGYR